MMPTPTLCAHIAEYTSTAAFLTRVLHWVISPAPDGEGLIGKFRGMFTRIVFIDTAYDNIVDEVGSRPHPPHFDPILYMCRQGKFQTTADGSKRFALGFMFHRIILASGGSTIALKELYVDDIKEPYWIAHASYFLDHETAVFHGMGDLQKFTAWDSQGYPTRSTRIASLPHVTNSFIVHLKDT